MEFVAPELFAAAHQQAIAQGGGLPVAQAQLSPGGPEGQHPCHGVGPAGQVAELLAEQQQPAALGHHRQPAVGCLGQGVQAPAAGGQLGGVQFRIAAGQQHGGMAWRQGFIGQGAPAAGLGTQGGQQFPDLGVAELKSPIAGDRHRHGLGP